MITGARDRGRRRRKGFRRVSLGAGKKMPSQEYAAAVTRRLREQQLINHSWGDSHAESIVFRSSARVLAVYVGGRAGGGFSRGHLLPRERHVFPPPCFHDNGGPGRAGKEIGVPPPRLGLPAEGCAGVETSLSLPHVFRSVPDSAG